MSTKKSAPAAGDVEQAEPTTTTEADLVAAQPEAEISPAPVPAPAPAPKAFAHIKVNIEFERGFAIVKVALENPDGTFTEEIQVSEQTASFTHVTAYAPIHLPILETLQQFEKVYGRDS